MTSQEQHVLDEFYKNAVMGADATSTILPKADHPDLRQELCKQLEFYQSRKEEIRSQMQQAHVQPVQQSDMAKFWANANIQLTEVLHNSPDISDQLKRQGKAFVRHEEAYMERLKAYL